MYSSVFQRVLRADFKDVYMIRHEVSAGTSITTTLMTELTMSRLHSTFAVAVCHCLELFD